MNDDDGDKKKNWMNSLVVCLWELRIRISMLSVSNAPLAAHRWKIKATSTCTINCTVTFTHAWRHWTPRHQMLVQMAWRPSPSNRKYRVCLLFNPFLLCVSRHSLYLPGYILFVLCLNIFQVSPSFSPPQRTTDQKVKSTQTKKLHQKNTFFPFVLCCVFKPFGDDFKMF